MTAGASRAAPTIAPQPALAPSPQPRPAPTARALPPGLVEQGGQNWTPIGGQIWAPIDRIKLFEIRGRHGFRISLGTGGSINHVSCFAHNAFAAASIRAAFIIPRPAASPTHSIDSLAQKEQKGNL